MQMTMEIRNSSGRKVSLLNDDLPRLSNLPKLQETSAALAPLQRSYGSYFPSADSYSSKSDGSTPGLSPPGLTPSLCRSDSSGSAAAQHSPSPPTPLSSGFEHLRQALPKRNKSQIDGLPGIESLSRRHSSLSSTSSTHNRHLPSGAARSSMDFTHNPLGASDFAFAPASSLLSTAPTFDPLAPLPTPVSLSAQQPLPNPVVFDPQAPLPVAPQPPAPYQQQPPVAPQRPQKKNSYPCPLSKQYKCGEFFTTSGHAARHAKKHTGKKDAICPECGKGFTRKDNMEQHRRTHANGRNSQNTHHNSTSSASSNPASNVSSASSATSVSKSLPKNVDSEESKARKKVQQQRKARPSSISTAAPLPQMPQMTQSTSQPSTATSAVPPTMDLLDPALREHTNFGFSPSSGGFDMYPFAQTGIALDGTAGQFQAPHAPMRTSNSSQGAASRMRLDARAGDGMNVARPRQGPTSPSLAPKLDALALVAEGVRRRDSNSSR